MSDPIVIVRPTVRRVVVQSPGPQGPRGSGWSPALSVVSDGERRVLRVIGWIGGTGTAPASGQYISDTGLVSEIGDAADIRGAIGESGSTVSWDDVLSKPDEFPPAPHTHTKSEVGLGDVDNTADAEKPVSAAQAAADTAVADAAAAALAAHEAAGDPHPGYTTAAELSAGLASKIGGSTGATDSAILVASGGGGLTLTARSGVTVDSSGNMIVGGRIRVGAGNGWSGSNNGGVGQELNIVASHSLLTGRGGQSDHLGMIGGGGFYFAGFADHMWMVSNVGRASSDATPVELFENGSSTRWVTPNNSSGVAILLFTARTSSSVAKSLHAARLVFWRKLTTAASLHVSVQTIGTDTQADGSAWPAGTAMTVDADTTNGNLRVRFTGEPATNYRTNAAMFNNQTLFP